MEETMKGAVLPGNSTVELRDYPVPKPGHGQVLVKMKACTICGSDIRAIYREHTGKGAEGYQGVIAGHEPCGQVVEEGPGVRRFKKGSRVIVYHLRMRRLSRLPHGLHDLLFIPPAGGLWLAAGRGHGRIHPLR